MGDKDLLKQIGERIYGKRKSLGITQEELAETVGVSEQMISNLECGKKAIRPENLVKVCSALNLSTDYVLTGGSTNSDIDDIIGKLSFLTQEELKMISELIDYMNSKK